MIRRPGEGTSATLRRRLGAERSDRGAVAVTVAVMMVVLVGIGAFTLDFGLSYASTRQLQTASDAAALAAANVFADKTGSCATILATPAWTAEAANAASAIREDNRPGSTEAGYTASCTAKGSIQVRYVSAGSTPNLLGGIFGHSGPYATSRPATAIVSAPSEAVGVRPYAVCGSQLPTVLPSTVFQMTLPSTGNSLCPGASSSGNWWSIDCPEVGSNSNTYLGTATEFGCTDPVSIVPAQSPRTGSALRSFLEGSCPAKSSSCLGANSGNLGGTPILQAWNSLVSSHKHILLPVFCGVPPCDQAAVVNAGGNNAIYPVQALLGVVVCGYHFGGQDSTALGMTGRCAGPTNNPSSLTPSTGGNQDNYLLLKAVKMRVAGSSDESDCALGSTCDLQQRQVYLIE
jgi:Flp pilus assembly protein TadG